MGISEKTKSQVDNFREAARELETDHSEEAFDRALKRVAVAPPKLKDDQPTKKKAGK